MVSDSTWSAEGHVNDLELSAYLDDRLPVADRERVESHMVECAVCRQQVRQSRRFLRYRTRRRRVMQLRALAAAGVVLVLGARAVRGPAADSTALREGAGAPLLV